MAQPLGEWVGEYVDPVRGQPPAWLTGHYFHRDPTRAIYGDPELILSPADGTIVHVGVVKPADRLGVKGGSSTVSELLDGLASDCDYLSVGIFLSFYDIHVLRAPISGWVTHRWSEPIRTTNASMIPSEHGLLDHGVAVQGAYFANERVISTFRAGKTLIHVVQIADEEVDHVLPFSHRPAGYCQGQRFSQIRFGSHAEVLIPLGGNLTVEPVCKSLTHVQAGVDPIVRLIRG